MDIEQRKRIALEKIERLGILDIHVDGGDLDLDAIETVIDLVEKHSPKTYREIDDIV